MARPKILVFQHVPYEPLGTLDPLLKESGFRIRYVNFGRNPDVRPTLDKYAAIIVLGGPMNVDQIENYPNLITEVDVLREAIDQDMSVLGICLGAQLLAKALGGSVHRKRRAGRFRSDFNSGTDRPFYRCFAGTEPADFFTLDRAFRIDATKAYLAVALASPHQSGRHSSGASCIKATCSRNARTWSSE